MAYNNPCGNCRHEYVCKYKDQYTDFLEKKAEYFFNDTPPFIDLNAKCSFYDSKVVSWSEM